MFQHKFKQTIVNRKKNNFTSLIDKHYCLILTALTNYQKSTNSTRVQLNEQYKQ